MLGGNSQHRNENSAEVSPSPPHSPFNPLMEKAEGGDCVFFGFCFFKKKGKRMRPSLSNTFIFWLSIYLFIFKFPRKECLGMRKSLFRAVFLQGRGGAGKVALSLPGLGSPAAAAGGCPCGRLAFLKPLFVLKRKPVEPRSGAALRASAIPPSPAPAPSSCLSLLCKSLRFCFEFYLDFFLRRVFFSRDPAVSRPLL